MMVVVSAKIPKSLKEQADKYGIKISSVVRESLRAKIEEVECQTLDDDIRRIQKDLGDRVTSEGIVKAVRLSRDQR